ncbi:MAG: hypothetical protein ACRC80_11880 [Waterburya sp.]
MLNIFTQESLLSYLQANLIQRDTLSLNALATLCGVSKTNIIESGHFRNLKLAQTLTEQGFEAGRIIENGFNAKACWLVIEYFAFDSKAKAEGAKQIARTFGTLGIMATFEKLSEPPVEIRQLKPVRDTVDWVECSKYISSLGDPILKSHLTQSLYEDLGVKALSSGDQRSVPIAVLARERGYTLASGQDSQLGKFAVKHLEPQGKAPHGRYQINLYSDCDRTREVVKAFFN